MNKPRQLHPLLGAGGKVIGQPQAVALISGLNLAAGVALHCRMTREAFLKNAEAAFDRMDPVNASAEALQAAHGGKGPPKPPERGQA